MEQWVGAMGTRSAGSLLGCHIIGNAGRGESEAAIASALRDQSQDRAAPLARANFTAQRWAEGPSWEIAPRARPQS